MRRSPCSSAAGISCVARAGTASGEGGLQPREHRLPPSRAGAVAGARHVDLAPAVAGDGAALAPVSSCGASARQRSIASGQRVWKRQPGGGSSGLGTSPCEQRCARAARPARGPAPPTSSACVYGWRGAAKSASRRPDLDDPAEVHHRDAVGDVPHHREVVRDEQVASGRSRPAGRASRLRICAWIETSSAETGSSQTMSRGSTASARAMPMRWRWPPENSCG